MPPAKGQPERAKATSAIGGLFPRKSVSSASHVQRKPRLTLPVIIRLESICAGPVKDIVGLSSQQNTSKLSDSKPLPIFQLITFAPKTQLELIILLRADARCLSSSLTSDFLTTLVLTMSGLFKLHHNSKSPHRNSAYVGPSRDSASLFRCLPNRDWGPTFIPLPSVGVGSGLYQSFLSLRLDLDCI